MSEQENVRFPFHLSAMVEALLFIGPGPVSVAQLAQALEATPREIEDALEELERGYQSRGLRVQRHRGRIQLTTAPELAELIETFLGLEAVSRLSQAALEALAIVAYRQPVTRPQIDAIRGVNSDSVLKSLLGKGLVQETGRAEGPGRPILYATTSEFLQHFGLREISELPPLSAPLDPAGPPNGEAAADHPDAPEN